MLFVVGVDGTDMSEQVLTHALAHARRWGAELRVVHVFHPPVSIYALEAGFAVEAEALSEAERRTVWERVTPLLERAGVPWQPVDLQGHPPTELAAYAGEAGADLLVVGTRGRGELAALVLGSTSHGVIHSAPCDVLVVRARSGGSTVS